MVVDWILLTRDATIGGDFFVGITHANLFPFAADGTQAPVDDAAPEKDPTSGATRPQLGNVFVGQRKTDAVGIFGNGNIVPGATADLLMHRFDGPWCLGPGQILMVERNLVTTGFTFAARGRYYPI